MRVVAVEPADNHVAAVPLRGRRAVGGQREHPGGAQRLTEVVVSDVLGVAGEPQGPLDRASDLTGAPGCVLRVRAIAEVLIARRARERGVVARAVPIWV